MPRRTSEVVVEIVTGDLTTEPVDAIVLKHAVEALFGAEIAVDRKLGGLISATFADHDLDPTGDSVCLPGKGISANYVLLVAIGSLYELTYKGVDVLARKMIQALSKHLPQADSFATTVHGPGIGLDPAECLKSQLLGFASALRRIDSPPPLSRIAIVEHEPFIAQILTQSLDSFSKAHPDVLIKTDGAYRLLLPSRGGAVEQVRFAALREPNIFVAMPFSKKFRNIYDYGIRLPILTVERKPIRIDDEHFNGSVIAKVKEHIRSSEMVIADMTGANPNVFFEVGFAEGVGKRTVLLCQDPGSLPFDAVLPTSPRESHFLMADSHPYSKQPDDLEAMMTPVTRLHADHPLDQLAAPCEYWRQHRSPPRERIPPALGAPAVPLTETLAPSRVAPHVRLGGRT